MPPQSDAASEDARCVSLLHDRDRRGKPVGSRFVETSLPTNRACRRRCALLGANIQLSVLSRRLQRHVL
eukprot:6374185-Prymnesium_polylepis.1